MQQRAKTSVGKITEGIRLGFCSSSLRLNFLRQKDLVIGYLALTALFSPRYCTRAGVLELERAP
jgi:hypothetical protein